MAEIDRNELKIMVAEIFRELLSIPENAMSLASSIAAANHKALSAQINENNRRMGTPVLVRTWYPDSIRGTVITKEADENGQVLDVVLEMKGEDGAFTEPNIDPELKDMLTKMVLSQTALPDDVYFITTAGAIDNAVKSAADGIAKMAGLEAAE